MGYESRLYVVNKTPSTTSVNGKKMFYCEKIATFNLSKVPYISEKLRKYKNTDGYIYAENYDDIIAEDNYGKPLTEIPISDVVTILENECAHSDYRRLKPCLDLLKAFDLSQWEDLVVLHYGY